MLVLLFVALWFILRGDLFYVLSCVILFLYFSVLLALRLPRFWKRELILLLFVRLFVLCMFGFVGFLFLLVSGEGCGSTDRSKAVVPVLVLLFVALWFILRGDLFYVLSCVILFLYFSVLLALRLPRFWKRELILLLFVRLFVLCMFGFVGFLFLLVSGEGCGSTDRSKVVVPVLVLLFGALWFILQGDFLDGDVPRRTSYGVYISHFVRFARASSNLNDFNYLYKALTAKLLRQGYRYFKLRKALSKFYRRHRKI